MSKSAPTTAKAEEERRYETELTELYKQDYPAFVNQWRRGKLGYNEAFHVAIKNAPGVDKDYGKVLEDMLLRTDAEGISFKRGFTAAVFNCNHQGTAWALEYQRKYRGGNEWAMFAKFVDYAAEDAWIQQRTAAVDCIRETLAKLPSWGIPVEWEKLVKSVRPRTQKTLAELKADISRAELEARIPRARAKKPKQKVGKAIKYL